MTREEAKEWIVKLISTMKEETSGMWADPQYKDEVYEALGMAIKALSAPTIPLSVIEDIKAEIEELGIWHEKLLIETIDIKRVLEIIDRKVNEVIHG